jgi:hypothetical protein
MRMSTTKFHTTWYVVQVLGTRSTAKYSCLLRNAFSLLVHCIPTTLSSELGALATSSCVNPFRSCGSCRSIMNNEMRICFDSASHWREQLKSTWALRRPSVYERKPGENEKCFVLYVNNKLLGARLKAASAGSNS